MLILIFTFLKYLFKSLAHFSMVLSLIFLMVYRSHLYILDAGVFFVICCKYLLSLYCLPFNSLNNLSWWTIFNSNEVQFVTFPLITFLLSCFKSLFLSRGPILSCRSFIFCYWHLDLQPTAWNLFGDWVCDGAVSFFMFWI